MTKSVILLDTLEEAEMVKLVNNTYRDVMFGFANEVSLVAKTWGSQGKKVIEAANLGYPRSNIPMPSPGVGGYCLEKDPYIFIASARKKKYKPVLMAQARATSARVLESMVEEIFLFLGKHKKNLDAKIFIIGFAFKGKPTTSDVRGSTTYNLIDLLKNKKLKNIHGYDPFVLPSDIERVNVTHVRDLKKGFTDVDIVVVMNNNPDFEKMDMRSYLAGIKKPVLLYDTWGLYQEEELSKVIHVTHKSL